jgi:hypothetical protein
MSETNTFLQYDYAETKDLLKTFLTLISATLVFSITFSEKVIGLRDAAISSKRALLTAWSLLIVALISSGLAMCFIAAAAGKSIYKSIPLLDWNYGTLALISWAFVLLAGIAYVGGLIAMALAGARSMGNRSSKPTSLGVQLINGSARATVRAARPIGSSARTRRHRL